MPNLVRIGSFSVFAIFGECGQDGLMDGQMDQRLSFSIAFLRFPRARSAQNLVKIACFVL